MRDACRDAGGDWTRVLELAEAQGTFPLLASRFSAANDLLGGPAGKAARKKFELHVRRCLVMTSELVRILRLLSSLQIEAIPFKGPALAQALYGDIAAREYSDLDILIRREQVATAAAALRDGGYSAVYPVSAQHQERFLDTGYEMAFSSPAGILIELHWEIAPRHFSMALRPQTLWADLRTVVVGGMETPALSPENLLLALSVHGAHHLWRKLRWLLDIHQLIAITPDLDYTLALRRARDAGIERIVRLALALTHSVLGTPLPHDVRQALDLDRAVTGLTAEVRRELLFRDDPFSDLQFHSFLLRVRERRLDRIRYVRRFVLTPTVEEWTRVGLPRPLHFLYSGIRVARGLAKASRIFYRNIRNVPHPQKAGRGGAPPHLSQDKPK